MTSFSLFRPKVVDRERNGDDDGGGASTGGREGVKRRTTSFRGGACRVVADGGGGRVERKVRVKESEARSKQGKREDELRNWQLGVECEWPGGGGKRYVGKQQQVGIHFGWDQGGPRR